MSRRPAAKIETDMFPFLSVLCSIIGVLMLFMLLILSTRVIADAQPTVFAMAPPPAPPPSPPPPKIQAGLSEQEYARLERRIHELSAVLADRQRELADFRSAVVKAEDIIASKEDENLRPVGGEGKVTGVELDMPVPVDVQMSQGPKTTKKPLFVEVKAEGYTIHDKAPGGQFHPAAEIDKAGSPLLAFLAAMERRAAKEYLVFLLHPNGISELNKIQKYMLEKFPHKDPKLAAEGYSRIDMGHEPYSPGWLLVKPKPEISAKQ